MSELSSYIAQFPELEDLRTDLARDERGWYASQRAVARITGLHRTTIDEGLRSGWRVVQPKMLRWLAAQGINPAGIQQEWSSGQIRDSHLAALIRYAATESLRPTAESKRWMRLIESVGMRTALNKLFGVSDLSERAAARLDLRKTQKPLVEKFQQTGANIANARSELTKAALGERPCDLKVRMQNECPQTRKSDGWRDRADTESLLVMQAAEALASISGVSAAIAGEQTRQIGMQGDWNGKVTFQDSRLNIKEAEKVNTNKQLSGQNAKKLRPDA
jgi:hypothetical protein